MTTIREIKTYEEEEIEQAQKRANIFVIVAFVVSVVLVVILVASCDRAFAEEIDMKKIAFIESSNNPLAHNKADDSRGLYQITPICLKEYNNFHKVKYTMNDLWNADVNGKIADWYLNIRIPQMLKHYGIKDTIRNRVIAYNAGIVAVINGRIPETTKKYLKKYGV